MSALDENPDGKGHVVVDDVPLLADQDMDDPSDGSESENDVEMTPPPRAQPAVQPAVSPSAQRLWTHFRGNFYRTEDKQNGVRNLVSDLLRSNNMFLPIGMPKSMTSTVDAVALMFTLVPTTELSVSEINPKDDMAAALMFLVKTFNESDQVELNGKITLRRFDNGYVTAALNDGEADDRLGWDYEGLELSKDHDCVMELVLARVESIIADNSLPLMVERVATRSISSLRATYFFKAPNGAIHNEGSEIHSLEILWFQCFIDEFCRQFPGARVKKQPFILHPSMTVKKKAPRKTNQPASSDSEPDAPDEPKHLNDVYFVAECHFPKGGFHLHDVNFNINPDGAPCADTGTVTAHFAVGDQVCFHCLKNGHLKSQCPEGGKAKPSRAATIAPHVYPALAIQDKCKLKKVDDAEFATPHVLSKPVFPKEKPETPTTEKPATRVNEPVKQQERGKRPLEEDGDDGFKSPPKPYRKPASSQPPPKATSSQSKNPFAMPGGDSESLENDSSPANLQVRGAFPGYNPNQENITLERKRMGQTKRIHQKGSTKAIHANVAAPQGAAHDAVVFSHPLDNNRLSSIKSGETLFLSVSSSFMNKKVRSEHNYRAEQEPKPDIVLQVDSSFKQLMTDDELLHFGILSLSEDDPTDTGLITSVRDHHDPDWVFFRYLSLKEPPRGLASLLGSFNAPGSVQSSVLVDSTSC